MKVIMTDGERVQCVTVLQWLKDGAVVYPHDAYVSPAPFFVPHDEIRMASEGRTIEEELQFQEGFIRKHSLRED